MIDIEKLLKDFPVVTLKEGENLLVQGKKTDSLYFLLNGELSIIRDNVEVASSSEKGSMYGEMSIILDIEHSATVKCLKESQFYQIEHPLNFLKTHPEIIWHITQTLSRRLYNVNNYLIDVNQKYHDELHVNIVNETLKLLQEQG